MAAAMLFSLHKNQFRNRFETGLTHFFDLKEAVLWRKMREKPVGTR